jgi:hypothetical protein
MYKVISFVGFFAFLWAIFGMDCGAISLPVGMFVGALGAVALVYGMKKLDMFY